MDLEGKPKSARGQVSELKFDFTVDNVGKCAVAFFARIVCLLLTWQMADAGFHTVAY